MPKSDAPDPRIDYYARLGVPPTATADEITRAFRARSKAWHPDVSDDADASAKFQEIVRAHDILSDAPTRAEYDRVRARVPIARYAGRIVARVADRVQERRAR